MILSRHDSVSFVLIGEIRVTLVGCDRSSSKFD